MKITTFFLSLRNIFNVRSEINPLSGRNGSTWRILLFQRQKNRRHPIISYTIWKLPNSCPDEKTRDLYFYNGKKGGLISEIICDPSLKLIKKKKHPYSIHMKKRTPPFCCRQEGLDRFMPLQDLKYLKELSKLSVCFCKRTKESTSVEPKQKKQTIVQSWIYMDHSHSQSNEN